jgi:hypothetical protein
MIDAIEPISGATPIYPVKENYLFDKKQVEKPEKAEEPRTSEDAVELSHRQKEVAPAQENIHQSSSQVEAEEARLVSEEWYRYGFESAYNETGG